jgi:hypothetical protein
MAHTNALREDTQHKPHKDHNIHRTATTHAARSSALVLAHRHHPITLTTMPNLARSGMRGTPKKNEFSRNATLNVQSLRVVG